MKQDAVPGSDVDGLAFRGLFECIEAFLVLFHAVGKGVVFVQKNRIDQFAVLEKRDILLERIDNFAMNIGVFPNGILLAPNGQDNKKYE